MIKLNTKQKCTSIQHSLGLLNTDQI